jgi:hypothetical protein
MLDPEQHKKPDQVHPTGGEQHNSRNGAQNWPGSKRQAAEMLIVLSAGVTAVVAVADQPDLVFPAVMALARLLTVLHWLD